MSAEPVTELLAASRAGDRGAFERVFAAVYAELRALARRQRARSRPGGTLSTTVLVHEAFLKLAQGSAVPVADREHFFALAARAMRHLLVDYARSKARSKRRGEHASLDPEALGTNDDTETVLAVHEALERLAAVDPRLVQVTECRYFAGLSVPETAEALGISVSTVERAWRAVRTYLGAQLAS